MKNYLLLIFCFLSFTISAQDKDSIWSGDYDGVFKKSNDAIRLRNGDSYEIGKLYDSLAVKEFYINGDSLLPDYLLSFKNLKRLNVYNFDKIKNIDLLSQLSQLTELSFCNSKFDKIPNDLVNLKCFSINTCRSRIGWNRVSDYSGFSDMKNLEYLALKYCGLNELPTEIFGLTKLKELYLEGNNINEFNGIEKLINLEVLQIPIGRFKKHLPKELIYLQKLKTLDLGIMFENNRKLKYEVLYQMPNLKKIIIGWYMMDNVYEEYKGIIELRKNRPDLEIVDYH